jgi:glucose-1-phosphate thymidylyltransferase
MAGMGKGLLLAASTRDDELTALAGTRAAHRLPVANRPLLSYGLSAMRASGIDDVAVIVSPGTARDVRALLTGGTDGALRVGCLEVAEPQGLVHALRAAAQFLDGRPVMVHLGDALVSQPLPPLFEELERSHADALLLVRNAAELSGQAPLAGGTEIRPLRLVEDRPVPPAEQALAGVFVLGAAGVEAALALPDHAGMPEIVRALGEAGGRLETRIVSGSWKYSGAVDGLLDANRMVLDEIETDVAGCDLSDARIEGRVQIHPTAIVERSTVRGPAVIGPRTVLQDAFVGPYSAIGSNVRLEGAEVEHSIVLDNAVIRHIGHRLEDSLVGNGATVTRDFAFPSGLRLRVGRRAEVLLA